MILVVGTVRVEHGALDKIAGAAETMIAATRAEDGCIRYAFARDMLDPQVMHVSEAWRDMDALKAHGAAPHMAEWRAAMKEAGVIERDIRVYATDEGTPI